MGNCLNPRQATECKYSSDEDWGSVEAESPKRYEEIEEKEGLYSTTKIKIKISKQQLEELLRLVDLQGLAAQEALAGLMKVKNTSVVDRPSSWRPALHSIPEVPE